MTVGDDTDTTAGPMTLDERAIEATPVTYGPDWATPEGATIDFKTLPDFDETCQAKHYRQWAQTAGFRALYGEHRTPATVRGSALHKVVEDYYRGKSYPLVAIDIETRPLQPALLTPGHHILSLDGVEVSPNDTRAIFARGHIVHDGHAFGIMQSIYPVSRRYFDNGPDPVQHDVEPDIRDEKPEALLDLGVPVASKFERTGGYRTEGTRKDNQAAKARKQARKQASRKSRKS